MVMANINNKVQTTANGNDISRIRLILTCPLSEWWPENKNRGCGCKSTTPWWHNACGGEDWIDKHGVIWCSSRCSSHGNRCIFDMNFICSTNNERSSRVKANHVSKIVAAMQACCGEVEDGGTLNGDQ